MLRFSYSIFCCSFIFLTLLVDPVIAQSNLQFRSIDVDGRLSINIPANWHVRDANERLNLAASVDAAQKNSGREVDPMHVSSLSVVSAVNKPQAVLRISFVAESGSQEEILADLKRGKANAVAELRTAWLEQVPQIAQTAAAQGGKYLGGEKFDFISLGGKTAMVISYRRASLTGGSPFRVTQYHVPMGKDKVLMTMSVQEEAIPLIMPVMDKIRASLVVKR